MFSPLLVFLGIQLVNFLTLFFVVKIKDKEARVLFTNRAFLFGDFLLIPSYFALFSLFLRENLSLIRALNPISYFLFGILALAVTLGSDKQFELLRLEWLPHGLFHWLVVFSFFLTAFVSLSFQIRNKEIVLLMILSLFLHQLLGKLYPKKL